MNVAVIDQPAFFASVVVAAAGEGGHAAIEARVHTSRKSAMPPALRVAVAVEEVGMFTPKGLKAVSEIWGSLEYKNNEDHHDGEKLTERLLKRLRTEGLMLDTAEEEHGRYPCTTSISRSYPWHLKSSKPRRSANTGLW
jgi:hypothetical protein